MNWQKKQKIKRANQMKIWMAGKGKAKKEEPPVNVHQVIENVRKEMRIKLPDVVTIEGKPQNEHPRNKFQRFLEKRGLVRLGSGYFSRVYAHPSSNKVIKVLNSPGTDGWVDYVKWANENGFGGTFAPKLYSYKHHKDGCFAVAVMERLDKTLHNLSLTSNRSLSLSEKTTKDKVTFLRSALSHGINENNDVAMAIADILQPGYRKFIDAFREKFGRGSGYGYDMHSGNWMLRGNDLVMSDPLSYCSSKSFEERFKLPKEIILPQKLEAHEEPWTSRSSPNNYTYS